MDTAARDTGDTSAVGARVRPGPDSNSPDLNRILIRFAFVALSWGTVPVATDGRGLIGLLLLIVTTIALVAASTRRRPNANVYTGILAAGAVASGVLFGIFNDTFAASLAFVIAGHAGFALDRMRAWLIGALASLSATASLFIVTHHDAFSLTALLIGLTVLVGMSRRDRIAALQSARDLVEETTRAAESDARARALAERARVARDIHDVLAHSLSGVNMKLNLADALLEEGRVDDGHRAVREATAMVTDGLSEARRAVYALREDTLDLSTVITSMTQSDNESVDIVGDSTTLDGEITRALARIVQESVTNARRHAPGLPLRIRLCYLPNAVTIDVENDLRSAVDHDTSGSGLGLIGMRERAEAIGAALTAGPTATGWSVHVEVTR